MHAPLTSRQERFVLEYLKDQNASAAAERAGYTARNMAAQGSELMSNPAVRERVRLEMQAVLAETRRAALELMQERMRVAHFRAERLFAYGWEPLPLEELDEETRQVLEVSTVQCKCGPVTRVRQPCRHKALRALEKAHEKLEQLNEQYYARLAREGAIPSLEEIEAMADAATGAVGPVPATGIAQKPRDLSGSGAMLLASTSQMAEIPQVLSGWHAVAPLDGEGADSIFAKNVSSLSSSRSAPASAESRIAENPQGLSGSAARSAAPGRALFAETHQVLSGWHAAAPLDGEGADPIFAKNVSSLSGSRSAAASADIRIAENPQGLSGSAARSAAPGRALLAENPQVLSGCGPAPWVTAPRIAENPQVLSGSNLRDGKTARARLAEKHRDLSGSARWARTAATRRPPSAVRGRGTIAPFHRPVTMRCA